MAACNRDMTGIAQAATVNVKEQVAQQVLAQSNVNKTPEVLRTEEAPIVVQHEAPIMHQTHATHYRDSNVHIHGEAGAGNVKENVQSQLRNKVNEPASVVRAEEAPLVVQHEAPVLHETHATHYKDTTVCHDGVKELNRRA